MCVYSCVCRTAKSQNWLWSAPKPSWANNIMLSLFIQQDIDPSTIVSCICVYVGWVKKIWELGTGPQKRGTFWKSNFDIQAIWLFLLTPRRTAWAAASSEENSRHQTPMNNHAASITWAENTHISLFFSCYTIHSTLTFTYTTVHKGR